MAGQKIIRVVTRAADGSLRIKEFTDFEELLSLHDQTGIDDCSTDLTLRGMPLFRGLVGPLPESKSIVRYESPEVFESLTKEWSAAKVKRRRRRKPEEIEAAKSAVPIPKMNIGLGRQTTSTPSNV